MGVTPWLLVAGDFTQCGGMDAANHALARYLAARGEVHLVTHHASADLAALPAITVHRVWRPFDRDFLGSALLARRGQEIWRQLVPRGVRAVVNGGNCQVPAANWVHYLHAAYLPVTAGSIMRRSRGRLIRAHDLAAEQRALNEARIVICNSRRTYGDVIALGGVEPSRAHVVYCGCDPVRFSAVGAADRAAAKAALAWSPGRPLVGFVGALGDRRKGFDTVFQAWAQLCRRRDWDANLVVVGFGAELSDWQRRAREAGLHDRICFTGERRDMPDVFAALDALVHPARYEPYGLSVQEALCRGVPALVSASAGVAEQYPGTLSELLIDRPDDPGELVERLGKWRCDSERFRSLVIPLAERLRAHTWDQMASEIAALVGAAESP
jgi:glycosyltransferase involved in cell wall biosynthesis